MSNKIQTITIIHRFDKTVAFPTTSEEFATFQQVNYIDTGIIISKSVVFDPDRLNKTLITVFNTVENYNNYMKEPAVLEVINARNSYCEANNMRVSIMKQELGEGSTFVEASVSATILAGS